jgi:hypothetical protein
MTVFTLRFLQVVLLSPLFLLQSNSNQMMVMAQVCTEASDASCSTNINTDDDIKVIEKLQALTDWFRAQGGFFHPALEIRFSRLEEDDIIEDDDEPSYKFGLFVKSDAIVKEGEQILYLSKNTLISMERKGLTRAEDICLISKELAVERIANQQQKCAFGPYIDFLEEFALGNVYLPAMWSNDGKYLLSKIYPKLETTFQQYFNCVNNVIIPEVDADSSDDYDDDSNMYDEVFWEKTLQMALSKSRNGMFCPIYDIIGHSNDPDKINVKNVDQIGSEAANGFGVNAIRDISPGEEIFHSYGLGQARHIVEYGILDFGMGTPDILRDFGILEMDQQRWYLETFQIDIAIRRKNATEPELIWLSDNQTIDDDAIYFISSEIERLKTVEEEMIEGMKSNESAMLHESEPLEQRISSQLLASMISAYGILLKEAKKMIVDQSTYELNEEKFYINCIDNFYFQTYQCDTLTLDVWQNAFDEIDSFRSAYQQIDYYRNPKTEDVCLFLDGVYQQCMVSWSKIIF